MLKALRLLAVAFALLSLADTAMAQTYKLTHAGLRTLYLAPLFVAMDRGMFKAHDLEVTYQEIDSGALSSAAVLSGAAQMTSDDLMGIAPLAEQGKQFLMIYNLLDRMTMDFVVRKEAIANSGIDPKSDCKIAPQDTQRIDHRHHQASGANGRLFPISDDRGGA